MESLKGKLSHLRHYDILGNSHGVTHKQKTQKCQDIWGNIIAMRGSTSAKHFV